MHWKKRSTQCKMKSRQSIKILEISLNCSDVAKDLLGILAEYPESSSDAADNKQCQIIVIRSSE
jgi:hypothetical protein